LNVSEFAQGMINQYQGGEKKSKSLINSDLTIREEVTPIPAPEPNAPGKKQ